MQACQAAAVGDADVASLATALHGFEAMFERHQGLAIQAQFDAQHTEFERQGSAIQARLDAQHTKFERQGLSMQAKLDAQQTEFERQGSALQAQLDAQQTEIAALKADSGGKEQRLQLAEARIAKHEERLESLSAQNGGLKSQIDRCSHRATKGPPKARGWKVKFTGLTQNSQVDPAV
jgi:chromosome segregation ATPase